jgi:hypothetical protein
LLVVEVSLIGKRPDPVSIVRQIAAEVQHPAAVVCFTDVSNTLPELCRHLDLEREELARLPHRILLWVTNHDLRYLAQHAPNFYSRISGVFRFPGTTARYSEPTDRGPQQSKTPDIAAPVYRRPIPSVTSEKDRQRMIDKYQRRAEALEKMARPDKNAIADTYYDIGSLYSTATPMRWSEAEDAYLKAAQAYASANNTVAQTNALALAVCPRLERIDPGCSTILGGSHYSLWLT